MGGRVYTEEAHQRFHDLHVTSAGNDTANDRPHSWMFTPIFDKLEGGNMVGMLSSVIAYDNYLSELLPDGVDGIMLVLRNSCGDAVTYELTGSKVGVDGKCRRPDLVHILTDTVASFCLI